MELGKAWQEYQTFLNNVRDGGAEGIRTPDPHNAIVVLYQLSYDPIQSERNVKTRPDLSKVFLLENTPTA